MLDTPEVAEKKEVQPSCFSNPAAVMEAINFLHNYTPQECEEELDSRKNIFLQFIRSVYAKLLNKTSGSKEDGTTPLGDSTYVAEHLYAIAPNEALGKPDIFAQIFQAAYQSGNEARIEMVNEILKASIDYLINESVEPLFNELEKVAKSNIYTNWERAGSQDPFSDAIGKVFGDVLLRHPKGLRTQGDAKYEIPPIPLISMDISQQESTGIGCEYCGAPHRDYNGGDGKAVSLELHFTRNDFSRPDCASGQYGSIVRLKCVGGNKGVFYLEQSDARNFMRYKDEIKFRDSFNKSAQEKIKRFLTREGLIPSDPGIADKSMEVVWAHIQASAEERLKSLRDKTGLFGLDDSSGFKNKEEGMTYADENKDATLGPIFDPTFFLLLHRIEKGKLDTRQSRKNLAYLAMRLAKQNIHYYQNGRYLDGYVKTAEESLAEYRINLNFRKSHIGGLRSSAKNLENIIETLQAQIDRFPWETLGYLKSPDSLCLNIHYAKALLSKMRVEIDDYDKPSIFR